MKLMEMVRLGLFLPGSCRQYHEGLCIYFSIRLLALGIFHFPRKKLGRVSSLI